MPSTKCRLASSKFGVWCFTGAWCLEFGALEIDWQLLRILDALLHGNEECNRFLPINRAVIVAEREIHHRANGNGIVDCNRPLNDRVHPENAALRWIQY